jgi:hypothetical protein
MENRGVLVDVQCYGLELISHRVVGDRGQLNDGVVSCQIGEGFSNVAIKLLVEISLGKYRGARQAMSEIGVIKTVQDRVRPGTAQIPCHLGPDIAHVTRDQYLHVCDSQPD